MPLRPSYFLKIALPVPLRRCFDYIVNDNIVNQPLLPGVRATVPFGKSKTKTGILLSLSNSNEFPLSKIKPISSIIDESPLLPNSHLQLLKWASSYYHHPIGEVVFTTLPKLLRNGNPVHRKVEYFWQLTDAGKSITLETLTRAPKQLALLQELRNSSNTNFTETFNSHNYKNVLTILNKKGLIEKVEKIIKYNFAINHSDLHKLNTDQRKAVDYISENLENHQCLLLNGITGSGKTEIYLQAVSQVIKAGRQAMILVPEIGLTSQLIDRIKKRIDTKISILHSALTDRERLQAWLDARDGNAKIILGTRSAIWTPLKNPGIFIVDEEHDISYKQQDGFKYSAKDIAIVRAKLADVPVVLGSATPSMESMQNVNSGKFSQVKLPQRTGEAKLPTINIIDMRAKNMVGTFSSTLLTAISDELNQQKQVLLFLNKRGFSPVIMCHDCGWVVKCDRCDIQMTFHKNLNKLSCHHCGKQNRVEKRCAECKGNELLHIGYGTERLEETLLEIFPSANILRIDRDSTRKKGSMRRMFTDINSGKADILIGTQILAKGHHFPKLTLVGVIDIDRGLFSTDFRASERMAQLLVQVSGRAGRIKQKGVVYIQTHFPEHPLLQSLVNKGYDEFAKLLLHERETANLPPFSYLAVLLAEDYKTEVTLDFLNKVKAELQKYASNIGVFGPIPAPIEKRAGRIRYQLFIQSDSRNSLHSSLTPWIKSIESLSITKKVRWSLDIDPQEIL